MTDDEKQQAVNAQIERYQHALHAMQTGVGYRMEWEKSRGIDNGETSPKHLRVGVNSALIDNGALLKMLIEKGIIDELEYFTTLADFAERDKASYEEWIQEHYGREGLNITLG